jgi:hypothetical protein
LQNIPFKYFAIQYLKQLINCSNTYGSSLFGGELDHYVIAAMVRQADPHNQRIRKAFWYR